MSSESDEQETFDIKTTTFVGHFKHVIRLNYPCGMFEDTRDSYGEPPTLLIIANTIARHKKECDKCT